MTENLLVNEIFGPTIQGEGPATGRECAFVRLAICPLRCRWCDTAYTWAFTPSLALKHQSHITYDRAEEVHPMSVEEVVDQVTIHLAGAQLVVLSGGEPLAQVPPRAQGLGLIVDQFNPDDEDDPVGTLIRQLSWRNIATHIETAGIRKPSATVHTYVERYVVSPKLASSGNNLAARRNDHVLEFFADTAKADFKFVITEPTDFTEIQHLANFHNITRDRIWVMPQGTTAKELDRSARMVAEGALKRGYNFSDRLHIRIWGEARKH